MKSDAEEFLEELKLLKYLTTFLETGFDNYDSILELNTEYMNDMQIPAGH